MTLSPEKLKGNTMPLPLKATVITGLFVGVVSMQGCSSYDPVPVSQCSKVVEHVSEILGKMAPSYSEMMKSCKASTDKKRGCAMAAITTGDISQCR